MTLLLEPDRYASARDLLEEASDHLAVVTVLAGALPGRVYVDDPARPGTAILIAANPYRLYAGGEPRAGMLTDVLRLLARESQDETYEFIAFYDTERPWKAAIEQALAGQELEAVRRQYYRLSAPPPPIITPLPDGVTIKAIDEAMVTDASLENSDLLAEELRSESPSLEYFFQRNFGFAAQDRRALIGWCTAEYHYEGRYELGIGTIAAYRRRGIATHLADTVIRRAFAQGATEIGWDCWAANEPSVATALKLGFAKTRDYPVCYGAYTLGLVV